MRHFVIAAMVVGSVATTAHADDSVSIRGVYYKERATRVEQPMIDAHLEPGENDTVDAHFLVDAITSASAATGADGVPFTEHRYEVGADWTHAFHKIKVGINGRVSDEPDYFSLFGGLHIEVPLAENNTVFGLSGNFGHDDVSNAGAQGPFVPSITGTLTSYLGSASLSQVVSKNAIIAVTYDVADLQGFQQNPYRTVIINGPVPELVSERHPTERIRQAVALSGRWYLPSTGTTLIGSYRYYYDDWGIVAHTPELRFIQAAGSSVEFGARYRYYWQTAANFYQDTYTTADPAINPYLSDDPKLSKFTGQTLEARMGIYGSAFDLGGRWGKAKLEGIMTYVVLGNRFGNASIAQIALTVPFRD